MAIQCYLANRNLRYNLGCSMVHLGDYETALDLFESVVLDGAPEGLVWFKKDSDVDPIREHPRSRALIAAAETRLAAKKPRLKRRPPRMRGSDLFGSCLQRDRPLRSAHVHRPGFANLVRREGKTKWICRIGRHITDEGAAEIVFGIDRPRALEGAAEAHARRDHVEAVVGT